MTPKTILVTGGAGFVGSPSPSASSALARSGAVVALDNLKRRGAELNLPRLRPAGVEFVHGDVREREDLEGTVAADLLIECSAEPSVLAGIGSSPDYVIRTNLIGTLNVLEYCRRHGRRCSSCRPAACTPSRRSAASGSRSARRASRSPRTRRCRACPSVGSAKRFRSSGARSLYGASKLASELFIEEYAAHYGLRAVVNRCGVIARSVADGKGRSRGGALWVARHLFNRDLTYIGFGGGGKQVRDVLHVDDLCELIDIQIARFETPERPDVQRRWRPHRCRFRCSSSPRCARRSRANIVPIHSVAESRAVDVPLYISDDTRVRELLGLTPSPDMRRVVEDVHAWVREHRRFLEPVLAR